MAEHAGALKKRLVLLSGVALFAVAGCGGGDDGGGGGGDVGGGDKAFVEEGIADQLPAELDPDIDGDLVEVTCVSEGEGSYTCLAEVSLGGAVAYTATCDDDACVWIPE